MVPKGLLTFLGFLGSVEFSPWKILQEVIELHTSLKKKKFTVVFVTASDAMIFVCLCFFVYRSCRVPEIKSYIVS